MAGKFHRNKACSSTVLFEVTKNFKQKPKRCVSCDEKITKTSTGMPDTQIMQSKI